MHARDGVYAQPSLTQEQLKALLQRVREAEQRVAELFGSYSAQPVLIVAANVESARRYSGNLHASMHPSPFGGSYVVLGPEGLASIDVIAHELAHAEHLARVGYLRWALTPAWFVEGLGMQVDNRPEYREAVLSALPAEQVPDAKSLDTFARFSEGDLTVNYAVSKREVARLLALLKRKGLDRLFQEQPLLSSFEEHLKAQLSAVPERPGT